MGSPTDSPSSATATVAPSSSTTSQPRQRGSGNLPLVGSTRTPTDAVPKSDSGLTDSGYGSQESSELAAPATSRPLPPNSFLLPITKSKTLIAYNITMRDEYLARFWTIQPLVETLLVEYSRRKSLFREPTPVQTIAIRPMLVGTTVLNAKPHIVVFCAAGMRKRIQHFFDTNETVRDFYRPSNQSIVSFEVAVCGCAPKLRFGFVDVIWDSVCPTTPVVRTKYENTMCGTPIQFHREGRQRNATLGGIIKLSYADGSFELRGLTAAHPAIACFANSDSILGVGDYGAEDEDEDEDDDSFVDGSDSEFSDTDSEVEAVPESDDPFGKRVAAKPHSPWSFEHPTHCGRAMIFSTVEHNTNNHRTAKFHDWMLLPLDTIKENGLGDVEPGKRVEGHIIEMPYNPSSWRHERVILMCGSGGRMKGRLSPQLARILVSPGRGFIDAYTVILDEGTLQDGDSGSWVISQATWELLGHVVATDLSGAGYVIPARDVFYDIARRTNAIDVTLPTAWELSLFPMTELFRSLTEEEMRYKASERGRGTRRLKVQPMVTSRAHWKDPDTTSAETPVPGSQSALSAHSGHVAPISAEGYTDREAQRFSLPPLREETHTVHRDEKERRKERPYSVNQPLTAEMLHKATAGSRHIWTSSARASGVQEYQDSITGGPRIPLTAEMLHRATRRDSYRHSDRSSFSQNDSDFRYSSRSGNDSDYRHSHATDITRPSSIGGPDPVTIKIGNTPVTVRIGNDVFTLRDDAEITIDSSGRPKVRPLTNTPSMAHPTGERGLYGPEPDYPRITIPYRERTPNHPGMRHSVTIRPPEHSGEGLHPSNSLDAFPDSALHTEPNDLEALPRSSSSDTPVDYSHGLGHADDGVYPKKGKTRIPNHLVSPGAIAELGYTYIQDVRDSS